MIGRIFARCCEKPANEPNEATWKRIGSLLGAFSPQDCANYLTKSGYASK